ncbi:MarR family winged helix-turn-helix transcriptional regulator [Gluconacetobacter sacchari]|uniref:Winged helix-turn-helix transcriptional regulator n=2 Tax=Gluconacetobacter sacchari TaxID=92759 RepID=A0A7W4NQC8_9PROT|nr:MarR family winged helix-turn-helix transcriptional regulator [Gluconacetobacter sacchari]MBB2162401.1 winged helix-turn-helix transcriptional regulator [Gluconacetobacter sacchari]GBQ22951.1 MarR family transcriptional regulator [Gluconacetobacter sacchari DSM 12717]
MKKIRNQTLNAVSDIIEMKSDRPTSPLTVSRSELTVNGSDRLFREMLHRLLAFSTLIQANRERLGRHIGLSGTQYTALISIAHMESDGIGIAQLAEHLNLSGAFVTIAVNKLTASGLVMKVPNAKDRRRVILSVTPKARELLARLAEVQVPVNDTIFRDISRDQMIELARTMSQLISGAQASLTLMDFLSE